MGKVELYKNARVICHESRENMVFRINPFIPVEVIAKVTKDPEMADDILTENSFLKLAYHEDYICRVYEEVIAYG